MFFECVAARFQRLLGGIVDARPNTVSGTLVSALPAASSFGEPTWRRRPRRTSPNGDRLRPLHYRHSLRLVGKIAATVVQL